MSKIGLCSKQKSVQSFTNINRILSFGDTKALHSESYYNHKHIMTSLWNDFLSVKIGCSFILHCVDPVIQVQC